MVGSLLVVAGGCGGVVGGWLVCMVGSPRGQAAAGTGRSGRGCGGAQAPGDEADGERGLDDDGDEVEGVDRRARVRGRPAPRTIRRGRRRRSPTCRWPAAGATEPPGRSRWPSTRHDSPKAMSPRRSRGRGAPRRRGRPGRPGSTVPPSPTASVARPSAADQLEQPDGDHRALDEAQHGAVEGEATVDVRAAAGTARRRPSTSRATITTSAAIPTPNSPGDVGDVAGGGGRVVGHDERAADGELGEDAGGDDPQVGDARCVRAIAAVAVWWSWVLLGVSVQR